MDPVLKLKVHVNGISPLINDGGTQTGEHVVLGGDLNTTFIINDTAAFGKLEVGKEYELNVVPVEAAPPVAA
jgi:hypothetical protein